MSSMEKTNTQIVLTENERIELEAIQWHQQRCSETNAETELAFDDWLSTSELHRQAYLEAELLADGFEQLADQPDIVEQLTVAANLDDQTFSNVVAIGSRSKTVWRAVTGMAIAASLAMVALVGMDWFGGQDQVSQPVVVSTFQAQYQSDIGELKEFALPDGSQLTLGPNSLVKVDFSDANRKVELVLGEAYFDVVKAPNRPFFVEADQASVRVVGTRFDVRRLANSTSVAVVEGIVQVFNGKESARLHSSKLLPTTLLAGQYAMSDGSADIVVQEDMREQDLVAWVEGRLVYRGAQLRDVLSDANRYSSVGNIRLNDSAIEKKLGEKKVTLSVNVDSIDELPLMLAELMNLTVSQNPSETVLSIKR